MKMKTVNVRIGTELDKKLTFLSGQCGVSTEDLMSVIVVLDSFHKGWIREPTPQKKIRK